MVDESGYRKIEGFLYSCVEEMQLRGVIGLNDDLSASNHYLWDADACQERPMGGEGGAGRGILCKNSLE